MQQEKRCVLVLVAPNRRVFSKYADNPKVSRLLRDLRTESRPLTVSDFCTSHAPVVCLSQLNEDLWLQLLDVGDDPPEVFFLASRPVWKGRIPTWFRGLKASFPAADTGIGVLRALRQWADRLKLLTGA